MSDEDMKKIAVVYHSGHGHTEHIAGCVVDDARRIVHKLVDH